MLMVLIAMATAMTLMMGWLASMDNSALVAVNANRAAAARACAQAALELASAVLESESPWQTSHSDGWILQAHPLGEGTVDVRLIDDLTGLPPTDGTTLVRIEATAWSDGMMQQASALATVHLFDDGSRGDLSGYTVFASNQLAISGNTRIRSWVGSGRGTRAMGSMGDVSISGRASRDLRSGDLCLHTPEAVGFGNSEAGNQAPLPTVLGLLGPEAIDLPMADENWTGTDDEASDEDRPGLSVWPWDTLTIGGDLDVAGDLDLYRGAVLRVTEDCTLTIPGNLWMNRDSRIEVAPGASLTVVLAGDADLNKAVIGGPQEDAPRSSTWRQRHITWRNPEQIRLVAPRGANAADWTIDNKSLVQAVIEAPTAHIEVDRSTITGRLVGDSVSLRRGTRLYYDHRSRTGSGVAALTDVVDRLDLMDVREGGLDQFARQDMIDRLNTLLQRPDGTTLAAPTDGWWIARPFPVQTSLTRFGGDIGAWEAAALAAADLEGNP
jgi:hypothetical protein